MRPLETLSISLLLITFLFFLFDKERTKFLVLLFLTIVVVIIQYFSEGLRWQCYPYIYLMPTIYICHRKQKNTIHLALKSFLTVWFLLAIIIPYIIPVFSLPKPQGEHTVGTETFHWVDSTRLEWFTPEKPEDYREIMVQLWYPSSSQPSNKTEPYMDYIDLRSKTIAAAGNLPSFFPSHLNLVKTNSYFQIACLEQTLGVPVVVFSHGITGSRHLHQALFEHLSSQGYIVAAIDHSYDCNLTVFPDGRIANYRSDITGDPDSISIRKQQLETRSRDVIFVLDKLTQIQSGKIKSMLNGKINLRKIAVGGHSYGGATAILSASRDDRINTCFILDGWINPVPNSIIKTGLRKPFLSVGRPDWKDSDYPDNYTYLSELVTNSAKPNYNIAIDKTLHLDYTDIPLYSPIIKYVMDVGTLSPSVSHVLINNLVHNFLESHLQGKSIENYHNHLNNKLISKL